jgi:hypothetical protein
MAENETPGLGAQVDPSEDTGTNASASAEGFESSGGKDEQDGAQKKDEPRTASKGINPVQHSE